MIVNAVSTLTIFYPGLAFQGRWKGAGWSIMKKSHEKTVEKPAKKPKWQSVGWLSRFRKDHGKAEEVKEFTSAEDDQVV
jgi:hypothetical protein